MLKQIARAGLHKFGGLEAAIWRSRKKFRILTYHRFSSSFHSGRPEAIEKQCAFLKRSFHPLGLAEIAASLNSGAPLPPRALAVTVDDGYRDFLLDAFPAFEAWKIPAAVFLITDFVDGKLWPWWNQVEYAARHGRAKSVRLSIRPQTPPQEMPLHTAEQRDRAASAICAELVKVPNRGRLAFLSGLSELFEVDIPAHAPPEYAALTWEDVRRLAKAGVEFGAHTRTHPVLPSVEDPDLLRDEIAGSKARIDRELGGAAIHFCYPNGDYSDAAVDAVKRCGFQTAVTTEAGINGPGANRYLLKRLSVDLDRPGEYFREQVAGLHT